MSFLSRQTTVDIKESKPDVAVLPIGAFEQHGPHMPLTTDTLIASIIAHEIAQAHNVLLLSPITISCSHEHAGFEGTVSIKASTLSLVIGDILESLEHQGIRRLVLVNAHGGNYVLKNIAQQANVGEPRVSIYPGPAEWENARLAAAMETNSHEDMHAGELEVSILLAHSPDWVREGFKDGDHIANDRAQLLTKRMDFYTSNGVIGRPSLASPEKGRKAVQRLVSDAAWSLLSPASRRDV